MKVFEVISIMIEFSVLIVAVIVLLFTFTQKKVNRPQLSSKWTVYHS